MPYGAQHATCCAPFSVPDRHVTRYERNAMLATLTARDAVHLCEIIAAAQHGHRIGRMIDGHVFHGVTMRLCQSDGRTAPADADVRTLFAEVVDQAGTVHYWHVGTLMSEMYDGTTVPCYETC